MANFKGLNNNITKKYLRIHGTESWRQRCLKQANYVCSVSGKKATKNHPLDVHHNGISFHSIMMDAHKSLGIKYHKYINEYTKEDLQAVLEAVIEAHKTTEGVVIMHNFHMVLHEQYGKNPTKDDYKEFRKTYKRLLYQRKNNSYRKAA